jgi:NitT/TauT family transport system substrate-binding protein
LRAQTVVTIGIGTQDTTTNTVTAGVIIRQLNLLTKYLPKDGKYANVKFEFEWNNFTSGPPVTNGMVANKLQFGMMGDYPLVVNGFTFQNNPESKSRLIAVAAYNRFGSGNGLVVHKDSPYFELSDLKGKLVSVPFGSAAHGMVLKAMQDRGWPADYFQLVSQSPEVGSTNLQEKKIDAHADFVPFAELLPFRGFARKIFDGVETNLPTWHGVVSRRPQAGVGKDPGMDRHQQGGRLHLPRVGREHDHRSDHQAFPDRRRSAGRQSAAEPRADEGIRRHQVGRRQLCPQGFRRAQARL